MTQLANLRQRLARFLDKADKPLLGLALVAVAVYLLDLRGVFGTGLGRNLVWAFTAVADSIFVLDLLLKLAVLGRPYLRSAWFPVDLLSCLPVLSWFGLGGWSAIRFVRGLRVLRGLRALRLLRVLRAVPAFSRLAEDTAATQESRRFHQAMWVGLPLFSVAFLLVILDTRADLESEWLTPIQAVLGRGVTAAEAAELGATLRPPEHVHYQAVTAVVDGRSRDVYLDRTSVEAHMNRVEFRLVFGTLLGMLLLLSIMIYHLRDVSYEQIRTVLNIALPRQVAEQLLKDPRSYTRRDRMPATIMFMDYVGFTSTCERLGDDLDTFSRHLETAMDTVVNELARHDIIIDKFIGDAVMCFRGGPLVEGDAAEHAFRMVRAALDGAQALQRLNDPYYNRIKIGGASAAKCLIGAFGTSTRLSYTVLGDGVNLAARLEPACGQCETQNLFCETTHRLCAGRSGLVWRHWGQIRVHGKRDLIKVYEALDSAEAGKAIFVETFHRAREAFERRDFPTAQELFHEADSQRPGGDPPSRRYVAWCEELIREPAPLDWEPLLRTKK